MRPPFLLFGLVLLAACVAGRDLDYLEHYSASVDAPAAHDLVASGSATVAGMASVEAGFQPQRAVARPPFTAQDLPGAMLIRRAQAFLAVDSLEAAIAALDSVARTLGGLVAGSSANTAGRVNSAMVTLRVPSDRLDEAVAGLKALGKIESVGITTDDVGEEFVDVTARLDNARRLERRLLELLSRRTGGIKDVLEVEQALGRVREEIERIQGRQRYLETRVATSTLDVRLHEPVPVISERLAAVLGGAFGQAWRNFVWIAALAIASLGVVIPLLVISVPIWMMWRRRRRPAYITAGAA